MQNEKGRTITFRVDDEVAEKLEKYAKMRNTSMPRVRRNQCQANDLRVEFSTRVRRIAPVLTPVYIKGVLAEMLMNKGAFSFYTWNIPSVIPNLW